MSIDQPHNPSNGNKLVTDSRNTVLFVAQGPGDSTRRPTRPEILRHLRRREPPPPPAEPPAPEKP
jgi:hypothetical protein